MVTLRTTSRDGKDEFVSGAQQTKVTWCPRLPRNSANSLASRNDPPKSSSYQAWHAIATWRALPGLVQHGIIDRDPGLRLALTTCFADQTLVLTHLRTLVRQSFPASPESLPRARRPQEQQQTASN